MAINPVWTKTHVGQKPPAGQSLKFGSRLYLGRSHLLVKIPFGQGKVLGTSPIWTKTHDGQMPPGQSPTIHESQWLVSSQLVCKISCWTMTLCWAWTPFGQRPMLGRGYLLPALPVKPLVIKVYVCKNMYRCLIYLTDIRWCFHTIFSEVRKCRYESQRLIMWVGVVHLSVMTLRKSRI